MNRPPFPAKHLLATALLTAAPLVVGCTSDKPHEYGQNRPPVDQIDDRDSGLQSKDVVAASDQMAQDLLALPELNASRDKWTIVVDHVQNETTDRSFNLDIFLERLRVNLAKYGHGRVALIENKKTYHGLQSNELEEDRNSDEFGQTGGDGGPKPVYRGIQPDYSLYAKIMEMPNRGTSYFLCEFTLTRFATREQVWTNSYEVKVAR